MYFQFYLLAARVSAVVRCLLTRCRLGRCS